MRFCFWGRSVTQTLSRVSAENSASRQVLIVCSLRFSMAHFGKLNDPGYRQYVQIKFRQAFLIVCWEIERALSRPLIAIVSSC
jgi:hypothetical protein